MNNPANNLAWLLCDLLKGTSKYVGALSMKTFLLPSFQESCKMMNKQDLSRENSRFNWEDFSSRS